MLRIKTLFESFCHCPCGFLECFEHSRVKQFDNRIEPHIMALLLSIKKEKNLKLGYKYHLNSSSNSARLLLIPNRLSALLSASSLDRLNTID